MVEKITLWPEDGLEVGADLFAEVELGIVEVGIVEVGIVELGIVEVGTVELGIKFEVGSEVVVLGGAVLEDESVGCLSGRELT